ncbi:MAG: DUF2066 domain-containing protein [Succinivibrio sp.]|jgi:hypothetical protein|nr:DUF2066 domain-containing protein [Succinivibrio sp.]
MMMRGLIPMFMAAAACAALADENPLDLQAPLSGGIDSAIVSGYEQAAASMALDKAAAASAAEAGRALESISIDGDTLNLRFDSQKLSQLLSSKGSATWSGLKDPVLVWLAHVSDGSIVAGNSADAFAVALSNAASKARYSLMFPVMDLDDVQAVNAQAILGQNDEALAKGSKRYAPAFFISGAVKDDGGQLSFKWTVCDDAGRRLGAAENSGTLDETAQQAAAAIAHVLMDNVSAADAQSASGKREGEATPASAGDSLALGPDKDKVRILITGADNISDLSAVRSSLITFGYEASAHSVAWTENGVIFEVPTSASPAILDGTLSHSGTFSKTGDWTYRLNRSAGPAASGRDGKVGAPSYASETSRPVMHAPAAAGAKTAASKPARRGRVSQLVED